MSTFQGRDKIEAAKKLVQALPTREALDQYQKDHHAEPLAEDKIASDIGEKIIPTPPPPRDGVC